MQRLRARASGPLRVTDEEVFVPGPLRAVSVDHEDRVIPGGFSIEADKELRVFFAKAGKQSRGARTSKARSDARRVVVLPDSVERCVASGQVILRWQQVTARGESLSYLPGTGWLELVSTARPITVDFGEDMHLESQPKLAVNLLTREWSSSRSRSVGRIRGLGSR